MFQTSETVLFAGSPVPETVYFVPGRPMSGFVVSVPRVAAVLKAGESGPGSAATPGMAGGVSALTSADALPVSSTAPVTAIAAVTATRLIRCVSEWVLIWVLAFQPP